MVIIFTWIVDSLFLTCILYDSIISVDDMTVFTQLNDSILDILAVSTDPMLEEAQKLLRRILQRDLYSCCGRHDYDEQTNHEKISGESIKNELLKFDEEHGGTLCSDDFVVSCIMLHHGKGIENPIDEVRFYGKKAEPDIDEHKSFHPPELDSPPVSQASTNSHFIRPVNRAGTCYKLSSETWGGIAVPLIQGVLRVRVYCRNADKKELISRYVYFCYIVE